MFRRASACLLFPSVGTKTLCYIYVLGVLFNLLDFACLPHLREGTALFSLIGFPIHFSLFRSIFFSNVYAMLPPIPVQWHGIEVPALPTISIVVFLTRACTSL